MPTVTHGALGFFPCQTGVALGRIPSALQIRFNLVELAAAITGIGVVTKLIRRLIVVPYAPGRVVRRGMEIVLPVLAVGGRIHRFRDAVARGRADDATHDSASSHANRATDGTDGCTSDSTCGCASSGADGMIFLDVRHGVSLLKIYAAIC